MPAYRIAGLTVLCDADLPGFPIEATPARPAEVVIRAAETPRTLADPVATGPTWAMAEGRFLLRVPGIARFLLRDGAEIDYQAEAEAEPGDVAAFLLGSAFGVLLHQRGLAVLHASSVAVNGKAALFVGPSGAGKSTLAAALVRRGYPLVADDFCVLSLGGGEVPFVHPDGGLPKLWAESIDELDLAGRQLGAVRGRLSKFYVETPALTAGAPLPLGPIFVLRDARAPRRPGIEAANVVDTALLIRANAYRPGVVRKFDQAPLYFQVAAAVGNGEGLFHLTRDFDFGRLDAVIDGLEGHWTRARAAPELA